MSIQSKINGNNYSIEPISHSLSLDFLKRHHYLAQQGHDFLSKFNYALFNNKKQMLGVVTFSGISVIETLIGAFEGFTRDSCQDGFFELSRLAMDDDLKTPNLTSWFLSRCIRRLRHDTTVRAIISYADSRYHKGYIYQATNFKYYGLTSPRPDFFYFDENGEEKQLWRGPTKGIDGVWKPRAQKHRYMLVFDKELYIQWEEQPYPKGDNEEYKLQEPEMVQMNIFDYM